MLGAPVLGLQARRRRLHQGARQGAGPHRHHRQRGLPRLRRDADGPAGPAGLRRGLGHHRGRRSSSKFKAKIPLGRYSTPEEVAGLVGYLATDAAAPSPRRPSTSAAASATSEPGSASAHAHRPSTVREVEHQITVTRRPRRGLPADRRRGELAADLPADASTSTTCERSRRSRSASGSGPPPTARPRTGPRAACSTPTRCGSSSGRRSPAPPVAADGRHLDHRAARRGRVAGCGCCTTTGPSTTTRRPGLDRRRRSTATAASELAALKTNVELAARLGRPGAVLRGHRPRSRARARTSTTSSTRRSSGRSGCRTWPRSVADGGHARRCRLLEMDTRTKDGSTHTTKSVRVCFPHRRSPTSRSRCPR